ncbi:protocadherin beta-14 [Linepithema humile]|uniref:protocadherin beta-14 n=1 Tax=Linepithema humile TaxID=83485 RepID=UPI00062311C5|nr:PREDICTED: protocadherin Fat 4-like [Linepithema humile]XP_012229934.1 PREDICTED: protocadherin Fat 4-like [Linepithema humile]
MGRNILSILLLLCCMLQSLVGQLTRDKRCFLENEATAVDLFVREDLSVGDTVGVLGVLGDPSSLGDIQLSLQENDSPVTLLSYSKNLTLVRKLDKEGIEGPASVYINVICERKHTLDPVFIIPVNIRVLDTNDNSPQFLNAPYLLNISEVTEVGTRVLQGVRAVDADQSGLNSNVQYSVLPGSYSDYFFFLSPLEGTLVLRKRLDYETLTNFSIGIRAQDQGEPPRSSTTTLYINVIDADDQNPVFLTEQYKVTVPRHVKGRKALKVWPAAIKAVDQDVGINSRIKYTIQGAILTFLDLNPETAEIVMIRSLQDQELITPATIIIKATQVDNPDKSTLASIIVSREDSYSVGPTAGGRLPVKFVLKNYQKSVPEDEKKGSVLLRAEVNKVDPNLRYWLSGARVDLQNFTITNSGDLILNGSLDYELQDQHYFQVHVTDGYNNDTSHVNISVENVNEWGPRFRYSEYILHAHSAREGSIIGRLEVADGDKGDKVRISLIGQDSRYFEVRDNGDLVLRSLGTFNRSKAQFMAIASDSGYPVQSSNEIPVTVHIPSSLPIAARAAPAWLGSSVLLVAIFGAVLGLLGVVILILILYIYKHKRPKSGSSVSSVGTGYREKSPVPSALSPTPQVLGASIIHDTLESPRDRHHNSDENDNAGNRNDIDNPVFGETNESSYGATIKSIASARQLPLYARHKVAPAPNPPALSATSNIPNIGGLVQNMNDLSARTNLDAASHDSSNYSGDPPDSLVPAWPASSVLPRIKKLSWDDDDRTVDSVEVAAETRTGDNQVGNERLNLTVYF